MAEKKRHSVTRVQDWVAVLDGASLVLKTPAGELWFCSGREGYAAALERGDIAFSPLEVVALVDGFARGVDLLGGGLEALVAMKRADPGARVVDLESLA